MDKINSKVNKMLKLILFFTLINLSPLFAQTITNITISNITHNSIVVSWDLLPSVDHYSVGVAKPGAPVATSVVSYATSPQLVTGLSSNTTYYVYIRSFDAIGNYLSQTVTSTFTTGATPNSPPELNSLEANALSITENDPPTLITNTITVSDIDNANLESATVTITGNFQSGEDILSFTDQNGITGNYNSATGILTLSGTSSVANYQTALRDVKYNNSSDAPNTSTRTVSIIVNDGVGNSNTLTRNMNVTSVNDAPALASIEGTALNFTEGDAATLLTSTITINDLDDNNLEGATVSITANFQTGGDELSFTDQNGITGSFDNLTGVMTLTGTSSLANYQSALRDVRYYNSSIAPNSNTRTVSFTVNDGTYISNTQTRNIDITSINSAPILSSIEVTTLVYAENDAPTSITGTITVSDDDDSNLESATIAITGNFQSGLDALNFTNQNGITGNFDNTTGVMTLSGTSSLANYQTAIRNVKFNNLSNAPNILTKTLTITINDGDDDSNISTRQLSITEVNDSPVLSMIEETILDYTENDAPTSVTNAIIVNDVDNSSISSATVSISGNFQSGEDVLSFTNQSGISGSYNSSTGVMTLTGISIKSNYQTALRNVMYSNSSSSPNTNTRILSFQVNDGKDNSNILTREINIILLNDPPMLTSIEETTLAYLENDAAISITNTIVISDIDDTNIESAVVSISENFQNGEDVLSFIDQNGITGSYDNLTGIITLSGSSTIENYQAALRNIKYSNTSSAPNQNTRTVSFIINDGEESSNIQSREITISAINDAPVISTLEEVILDYVENDAPKIISNSITVTDPDNTSMVSAIVKITNNFQSSEDVLSFTDQNGITGIWDDAQGILNLSGNASIADYKTALKNVQYHNTSSNPSTLFRKVIFQINDGDLNSNQLSANINVIAVNNAPNLSNIESTILEYSENGMPVQITNTIIVDDEDNNHINWAAVQITDNYIPTEDELSFTDNNGITGNWDKETGILTLNGNGTKNNYQEALRNVKYFNISNNPSVLTKTISFYVDDGISANQLMIKNPNQFGNKVQMGSNSISRSINILPVNDAPFLNEVDNSKIIINEGAEAIVVANTIGIVDEDDKHLVKAEVFISGRTYVKGEDKLDSEYGFWDEENGKLLIEGVKALEDYENILREIKYQNSNTSHTQTVERAISFQVFDDLTNSNIIMKIVRIEHVNNAPVLSNIETQTLSYPLLGDAKLITETIAIDDIDGNAITNAGLQIVNNYNPEQDTLIYVDNATIKGTFYNELGRLTLSGVDTKENYETALRSVKYYTKTDDTPNNLSRTISFRVGDGLISSNVVERKIYISLPIEVPVVTNLPDVINIPGLDTISIKIWDYVEDQYTPDNELEFEFYTDISALDVEYNPLTGEVIVTKSNDFSGEVEVNVKVTNKYGSNTEVNFKLNFLVTTGIDIPLTGIPQEYNLYQNYPNPFNPSTKIRYALPKESNVELIIYNTLGEEVLKLVNQVQSGGFHEVEFNAGSLSSGLYIYRIIANDFTQTRKLLLLK